MKHTIKKSKRMVKESYEVSEELVDRLNSILADEFLAAEFYRLAELAMKGNKQHRLSEIADENGEDELEDHFKNLSEWMQSKGIRVVTNHDEMLDITNATVFTVEDGDSTKDIVDKLIQSEEEAIEAYEDLIPDTDLDLHTMLCGFLKDEREHLKVLTDARDEMGGSRYDGEDKPKHAIYESYEYSCLKDIIAHLSAEYDGRKLDDGAFARKLESFNGQKSTYNNNFFELPDGTVLHEHFDEYYETGDLHLWKFGGELFNGEYVGYTEGDDGKLNFTSTVLTEGNEEKDVKFRVYNIDWDTDGEDVDLPNEIEVNVPAEVVDYDDVNDYISDWLSDEYGFCHNGFLLEEI